MNAEQEDRLEQIARCCAEIARCEKEFPDRTGIGAELGYYDWLDELHYQVKERAMVRRVVCDRSPILEHDENAGGMSCVNPRSIAPPSKPDWPALVQKAQAIEDARRGIGGAPTRATTLPTKPAERKKFPVASGFMD